MADREELVLTFGLSSGAFTSELRMPLPKGKKAVDEAVAKWIDFIATGLRMSATQMDAKFPIEEDE